MKHFMNGHDRKRDRLWKAIAVIWLLFPALAMSARSQENATILNVAPQIGQIPVTSQLINELEDAISSNDESKIQSLLKQMGNPDANSISVIRSSLTRQRLLQSYLMRVISTSSNTDSKDLMLDLAFWDIIDETAGQAFFRLDNYQLQRPLSKREMQAFSFRVLTADGIGAGYTARFLGHAGHNAPSERLTPILTRFKREVENPVPLALVPGVDVSGQAYVLKQFLLAFSYIEKKTVIETLRNEMKGGGNPILNKWLIVALGYAGDDSVAEQLKVLLNEEKDTSTRVLVLSAYAKSAKEDAIPTLENFLTDTTVTGSGSFGPIYGLRMGARSELAMLRAKKTTDQVKPQ